MTETRIMAEALIPAPPTTVYTMLADYHIGHVLALPTRHFRDLVVEEGGQGAGTIFHMRSEVLGVTQTIRMRVSEPEPGHILEEAAFDGQMVTRFIVDAAPSGITHLTILTRYQTAPGIRGWIEGRLIRNALGRIYHTELRQIARVLTAPPTSPQPEGVDK